MTGKPKLTTVMSTKGQFILPKSVREEKNWGPGTRVTVEQTPDGVLLKAEPLFPPTRMEDVYGILAYKGPPKTLEEMDAGVEAEIMARHARGRY